MPRQAPHCLSFCSVCWFVRCKIILQLYSGQFVKLFTINFVQPSRTFEYNCFSWRCRLLNIQLLKLFNHRWNPRPGQQEGIHIGLPLCYHRSHRSHRSPATNRRFSKTISLDCSPSARFPTISHSVSIEICVSNTLQFHTCPSNFTSNLQGSSLHFRQNQPSSGHFPKLPRRRPFSL